MKKYFFLALCCSSLLVFSACSQSILDTGNRDLAQSYNQEGLINQTSQSLKINKGLKRVIIKTSQSAYGSIVDYLKANGSITGKVARKNLVFAKLSESVLVELAAKDEVVSITDDSPVSILAKKGFEYEVKKIGTQEMPWGINRIDAEKVIFNRGKGIRVAVVDTGIDETHEDLAHLVVGGINTILENDNYYDDHGHGTHVSGTIAARNNLLGVVGVATGVDLYAVKVLNAQGSGYYSDIIEGIYWCIEQGVQVVNMSLGGSSYNSDFEAAMADAYAAGIVLVAAAGNSYGGSVGYPAAFSTVIAVSASNEMDELAYFSSVGPQVELIAPGQNVLSTLPGNSYAYYNGTSMACPHVAGVASLILYAFPTFTNVDVRAQMQNTAELLPNLTSDEQGYGLIDARESTL